MTANKFCIVITRLCYAVTTASVINKCCGTIITIWQAHHDLLSWRFCGIVAIEEPDDEASTVYGTTTSKATLVFGVISNDHGALRWR